MYICIMYTYKAFDYLLLQLEVCKSHFCHISFCLFFFVNFLSSYSVLKIQRARLFVNECNVIVMQLFTLLRVAQLINKLSERRFTASSISSV